MRLPDPTHLTPVLFPGNEASLAAHQDDGLLACAGDAFQPNAIHQITQNVTISMAAKTKSSGSLGRAASVPRIAIGASSKLSHRAATGRRKLESKKPSNSSSTRNALMSNKPSDMGVPFR